MTTTAQALETETVVLLPVGQLHKSPSQPRRRGDATPEDDFVASIRQKGVVSPIIVRVRKAGGWEIVYGHRRHAGSVLAKRDTIPGIVRDLTDDEVFELQLIENVHRQDMHPLDEADGFKRLRDRNGRSVQQIADSIGRSSTYVAQRLKLADLGKEGRAALDKDDISLGVAVLLARVPAALQADALGQLRFHSHDTREAKRDLEETFLLRLDHAPFDVESTTLVVAAGACTACPKRTGQQRELFPDVKRADLCIDPVCYRAKVDALWQIRKKEATAGGQAVLEGRAARKAIDEYNGPFMKLDAEQYIAGKYQTLRPLFGENLPPVTLARDEKTGAIVELVKRADAAKVTKRRPEPADSDSYRAQARRQQQKDQLRSAAVGTAIGQAIDAIGKLGSAGLVRLLTRALVARTWDDSEKKVMSRRGVTKVKGQGTRGTLEAYLRTLTKPSDVAGLGLELALWTFAPTRWGSTEKEWGETMKVTGVNFAAIERKLKDEAAAKKKAKKTAKKSKGKAKAR
jgi:ParB/RepB/Spo0J family partition protein